jgi:steroid delta-isomerase-like uncharacterized protein
MSADPAPPTAGACTPCAAAASGRLRLHDTTGCTRRAVRRRGRAAVASLLLSVGPLTLTPLAMTAPVNAPAGGASAAGPDTRRANAERARAFFAAYDRHDIPAMLALCAPGATFEYVPYGEQGKGRIHEQAPAVWQGFFDAFPDFRVRVDNVMAAEDGTVITENVQGGTQTKDIIGITSKGRSQYTPHVFIVRFDGEGRIAHLKAYWDNDTIFRQLGHTETHP